MIFVFLQKVLQNFKKGIKIRAYYSKRDKIMKAFSSRFHWIVDVIEIMLILIVMGIVFIHAS